MRLRELQARFLGAVAGGVETATPLRDESLLAAITGDETLGAAARLGIYADMYAARLVDVLREDYPRLAALLGEEAFDALARAYLVRHRPRRPSVRWAGDRFAAFLREPRRPEDTWPPQPPWLADLAQIEWLRGEVFDAPEAAPLTLEALRALAPEAWADARFDVVPAVRFLHSEWPVHELWGASTLGETLAIAPAETEIRVWRQEFAVYHVAMPAIEAGAIACLRAGGTFAEVCEVVAARLPAEEAAPRAGALLLRWVADGVVAAATAG